MSEDSLAHKFDPTRGERLLIDTDRTSSSRGVYIQKKKVDFEISESSKSELSCSALKNSLAGSNLSYGQRLERMRKVALQFDSDLELQESFTHQSKTLKKFLKSPRMLEDDQDSHPLLEKMLIEFPVFALNEDFMRALAIIIHGKATQFIRLLDDRAEEVET
mmetsp:Transcript_19020/g.29169  ORF Transcript_19020/g.29169 Transcript_19020/m.29169 type:complete len:162 (-) Transcript_19020:1834-2319(-)|eukprot:CAMPEP_0170507570 /NCGR_PEP_ID=MMETSP0208-20121228/59319_1 /TAXON_ID=197538 /ORGANISM="Strombidium inclinatum, Strain S3" /LENGTH=161 /DNA_ID=CAMNT_0010789847 /DNA_START=486 /DNA_END=971 /DNA_ORIENTATION=-